MGNMNFTPSGLNLKKRRGKSMVVFSCIICFLFFSISVAAQNQRSIIGLVTDISGEPVIGATIQETGNSKKGTITDVDGKFSILVSEKTSSLTFSYIGYKTQVVSILDKDRLKVQLHEDSQTLDEVVVVGYGTMKRSDLTGAISSVDMDELPRTGNTSVAQMLNGQIAGMSFYQSTTQPGAKVSLQIRGSAAGASPLLVIDGFPVNSLWETGTQNQYSKGEKEDVFDYLNPDDIADIQVLKDASATSIYGSRAAGGVILVTTKRGTDSRPTVSFSTSYTHEYINNKPEVMSPKQYMGEVNKSILENWVLEQGYFPWGTRELPSYNDLVTEFKADHAGQQFGGFRYDPNAIDNFQGGTNWFDAVTRTGGIQKYDLSVRGGSGKTKYAISLGRMNNKGVVKNNDYSRTTGRINLDQQFNSWLSAGVSLNYTSNISNDIVLGGNGDVQSVFGAARNFDPTLPIKDEDGNYTESTTIGYAKNPVSILDVSMQTKKENLLATAYVEVRPFKGFTLKGTAGYNRKIGICNSYIPSTTYEGKGVGGSATKNMDEQSDYLLNFVATYNHTFAEKHSLTATAGWEYQQFNTDGFNATNTGFPYDMVKWHNLWLGTAERPTVGSYTTLSENASVFGRINYSYDNRYLFTANYRMDGSSNFAPNKQWGHFGGGSLAWRISEESFIKDNVSWLDNLKLRFGAGITGYAGNLTGTRTYYAVGTNYYFNNKITPGVALSVLGNTELSWESQRDLNLGLDFGLSNNRLTGSFEIYERTIFNRIGKKSLMSYQEVNTIAYNTKRIDKTRGIDLSIHGAIIDKQNFSWDSQFTFTYYRDMTTRRDPSEVLDIYDMEKYHWNDLWYYISDGLVKPGETVASQSGAKAGAIKIKDLNGYLRDENGNKIYDKNGKPLYSGKPDGMIDNADKVRIGNSTPIPFSWSNTFRYKNFDLNIFFYGRLSQYKDNDWEGYGDQVSILNGSNSPTSIIGRMSFDNLDSDIPSFQKNSGGNGVGDFFLEKFWFVRLDNVTLGYTLPKKLTKNICQSVRFYAGGKNLCVMTSYKGADPEFDVYGSYPTTRSFTVGLDVKF